MKNPEKENCTIDIIEVITYLERDFTPENLKESYQFCIKQYIGKLKNAVRYLDSNDI